MASSPSLADSLGRHIEYLRLSLTQRCDLRCAYCHPGPHAAAAPHDVLSADDVLTIAQAALRLGIHRIRLTGGEPLLRDDLEEIVHRLRGLPGLDDLALTTNGQRLAPRAAALAAAGLMRVNISLDSLNPQAYAAVTGGGDLQMVLQGLDATLAAGLSPVKINVVLLRRAFLERDELTAFADLVRRRPVHVRFIEAMPTCDHLGYLPAPRVLDLLAARDRLVPVPGPTGGGPARYWRLGDSPGTVGAITPISAPFCSHCNRLRITARAQLKPCLFSPDGFDLLPALAGADPVSAVAELIARAAAAKPARWGDVPQSPRLLSMHTIGG